MKKQEKVDDDLTFLDQRFSDKLTYKMLMVFGFIPCTIDKRETIYYFLNLTAERKLIFVRKIYEYMKQNPDVILPNYSFLNELRTTINKSKI